MNNIRSNGIIRNKIFWKALKSFLTNKGCLENNDIRQNDYRREEISATF